MAEGHDNALGEVGVHEPVVDASLEGGTEDLDLLLPRRCGEAGTPGPDLDVGGVEGRHDAVTERLPHCRCVVTIRADRVWGAAGVCFGSQMAVQEGADGD